MSTPQQGVPPWRVSVAPMMRRTDRHHRYFMRCITRRALLYTEMITTDAILHGDRERHLAFHPDERPLALQIAGSDPARCAEALRIAADWGYDEYNLNVGCPSERVRGRALGACLMADPDRVARIVEAMKCATDRAVTVKHRIGIDGREHYRDLLQFVRCVASAGVDRVIVHARVAILQGLNPKQNRSIPPLRYEDVYRLKREIPRLTVELNGGIRDGDAIDHHLQRVDGVMIGRAAYDDPWLFADMDACLFGARHPVPTRRSVAEAMLAYIEEQEGRGVRPHSILMHLQGLFHGQPGARHWRRSVCSPSSTGGAETLRQALASLSAC